MTYVIPDLRLKWKYIIEADIKALTGLHIGTGKNRFEIGGVDNAVIKDAWGRPYIPGSSLKGKMRALLEMATGVLVPGKMVIVKGEEDGRDSEEPIRIHMCDEPACPVCLLFGRNHGAHRRINEQGVEDKDKPIFKNVTPTRLKVRDAYLDPESITEEMKRNLDLEWTEVKFENVLDRITSMANPRQNERVPRGARFKAEMALTVFAGDDEKVLLKNLLLAMQLLEDDAIGGSGSRGYGRIAFSGLRVYRRSPEDYLQGRSAEVLVESPNLRELQSALLETLKA